MNILDDLKQIKILDKKNALDSIKQLPEQINQAWQESFSIDFPRNYLEIRNVVISGMGGSTYGARIVKSLYDRTKMTRVPIELANNYFLPGYVNEDTLVILSSYSGNTEETLSTAREAKEKSAKIVGLTSGGQLGDFLKSNNYPAYIFNPKYNPCAQPRIGVGYMVTGLLGMLAKMNLIPTSSEEIVNIVSFLNSTNTDTAKKFALTLNDKIPVLIVSDFLDGAAYAIRNPFHETAKQFALYFSVPELNHHLLEGLAFPQNLKGNLYFVLFDSSLYDKRNIKRMNLTADVISKNKIPCERISLTGKTALTQVFELIQWGSWVTFYLAMLHGIDPSEIPWVDYFKKSLASTPGVERGGL